MLDLSNMLRSAVRSDRPSTCPRDELVLVLTAYGHIAMQLACADRPGGGETLGERSIDPCRRIVFPDSAERVQ